MPHLDAAITLIVVQKEIIPQLLVTDAVPRIGRSSLMDNTDLTIRDRMIASLDGKFLLHIHMYRPNRVIP